MDKESQGLKAKVELALCLQLLEYQLLVLHVNVLCKRNYELISKFIVSGAWTIVKSNSSISSHQNT